MEQDFKIPTCEEYIHSLTGKTDENQKKNFSFPKVFFALVVCIAVTISLFRGESAVDFMLTNWGLQAESNIQSECSETETHFANKIKPENQEESFRQENELLKAEKAGLDERKEKITKEIEEMKQLSAAEAKAKNKELDLKSDEYNKEVAAFNAKYDDYEERLKIYNETVRLYNEYIKLNCND